MTVTPDPTLHRILVGVDGSANSVEAVRWAAAVAAVTGAEVVAVHALGLTERLDAPSPTAAEGHQEQFAVEGHQEQIADLMASEWCAPLRQAGVAFECEMRYGPPVAVLLEASERSAADLVVVGSRGLGRPLASLLGSTSSQLANRSRRPLLIVPDRRAGSDP